MDTLLVASSGLLGQARVRRVSGTVSGGVSGTAGASVRTSIAAPSVASGSTTARTTAGPIRRRDASTTAARRPAGW